MALRIYDGTAAEAARLAREAEGRRLGYARVSTSDQDAGNQTAKLVAAGVDLANIYTDTGWSGRKASRPEWDRLLADLRPGDTLVAVRLDRLGRSVGDLAKLAERLADLDVDLVVTDQAIDTTSATGRLLYNLLAAIAEFEADLLVDRLADRLAKVRQDANLRAAQGGPPPIGYRDGAEDWETDEAHAAVMRDVATRHLAGESFHAAYLAQPAIYVEATEGTGKRGGRRRYRVTEKALRAALQRPASAGLMSRTHGDGAVEILGPSAVADPPLSEATWWDLQAVFASRARGRQAGERFYLGPVLACGSCGNQLTGGTVYDRRRDPETGAWVVHKSTPVYACKVAHKIGEDADGQPVYNRPCRGVSIPAADVHRLVQAAVEEWAEASDYASAAAAERTGLDTERAATQAALTRARTRAASLVAKASALDPATFDVMLGRFQDEVEALEAKLATLAASGLPPEVVDWDAQTPGERLALVHRVLAPITVQPGNGGAKAIPAAQRITLEPRLAQPAA
jgi:DNA invertase Pin-like site-specific DNA recombinase